MLLILEIKILPYYLKQLYILEEMDKHNSIQHTIL